MAKKEQDYIGIVAKFCLTVEKQNLKGPLRLAVDPGASGALALMCGKEYVVLDIPVIMVKKGRKNRSSPNFAAIIEMMKFLKTGTRKVIHRHAIIEEAQIGIPGRGNSAFNGYTVACHYAFWEPVLLLLGFTVEVVRPGDWKKKMGLASKDKETSRRKAMSMFPKAELSRKQDHDRAEALLLAEFLKRTQLGRL